MHMASHKRKEKRKNRTIRKRIHIPCNTEAFQIIEPFELNKTTRVEIDKPAHRKPSSGHIAL